MAFEYHYQRRVEFADTDAASIIHFATYFRYMEEAEHAFFRSIGFSIIHEHEGKTYSWPRLSCQCDFSRPVQFEDELDVHLRVVGIGTKSLTFDYRFRHQGQDVAQGKMVIVCCTMHPGGGIEGVRIPDHLRTHLDMAPESSQD